MSALEKPPSPVLCPQLHLAAKAASEHVHQAAGVTPVTGTRAIAVLLDLKIRLKFCS